MGPWNKIAARMQDAKVWFIGGKGCSNKDEVRSKKIMSESILTKSVRYPTLIIQYIYL